ncbi:hypothetical protein [Nonomuraea zeae]|uniref:PLL-like beta propeller domain-containing protein n=1 Tax=Nonomuraea zeae TaxID=1642303 RepID=A0A5S4HG13_9ACTN|nr:hypothetical protein [Nonomuraea zeae]TMR37900.1 hypothetical protein ETD85_06655 [Nonomuraea zeae]
MALPRWLRKPAVAAVIVAASVLALAPPASAAPPPYAADLPELSTPNVAYNLSPFAATGVAVRGADGSLLFSRRSGSAFGPLQSLGGSIVGDPSVVVTTAGTQFFVRGTDDQVYTNTITPSGAVTGYSAVPGLTATGDVEAIVPNVSPLGSVVRIFARGTDGAVWTNVLRNGQWTGWSSLGGFATSDITAARTFVFPTDTVRVFIRGSDHRVYVSRVTTTSATSFQPLGDLQVTSNIAVAEDFYFAGGEIWARGQDNGLYTYSLVVAPQSWKPLGGTLTSDIAASGQPNITYLYSRGPDGAITVNKRGPDGVYRGFERLDGAVTGNPAAFGTGPNGPLTEFLLARLGSGALAANLELGSVLQPPNQFTGYVPIAGPPVG